MKKTVRNIVIMLVLLAVLGGATFFLLQLPQSGEQDNVSTADSSQESTDQEVLLSRELSTVRSIKVENSSGDFTVVQKSDSDKESPEFTIEGYEEYELNTAQLTSNVRSALNLKAIKNLGERDDLEAFGLGEDAVKLTMNYDSTDSDVVLLGNDAAESIGKYVLMNKKVYIVPSIPAYFYGSKFAYFYNDIYEINDRTIITTDKDGNEQESTGEDIISSINLSGKKFSEPISIEYNSKVVSKYLVKEPVVAESGTTAFFEMVTSLKSLTATSVVDAGITDDLLEKYGLKEPDAQIEFKLNDSEHKLSVSAKDDEGNRFLIADDKDLIYKVDNSLVEKWAEIELMKLRMSYIWIPNINDVQNLKVILDGDQVYEYNVSRTVDEEKSTESNTVYILSITDVSGNDISYDDSYQPFYMKLLSLAVFSEENAEYSDVPDVKVQYSYFDGGSDTIELYKVKDQNRYVAELNGDFNGQIRSTEVNAMLEVLP